MISGTKKQSVARDGAHRQPAIQLEAIENPARLSQSVRLQRVVVPSPFPSAGDDSGIGKRLEVPGQSRLREIEVRHQVAHAPLAVEQHCHDVDADRVSEGVKELGGASGVDAGGGRHESERNEFS